LTIFVHPFWGTVTVLVGLSFLPLSDRTSRQVLGLVLGISVGSQELGFSGHGGGFNNFLICIPTWGDDPI